MIRTEKGELIMLEFLQTGRMLYVLAAICALGTLSKLATGSLYKRLIKETGNMALTKDKNLKTLKQRMENVFPYQPRDPKCKRIHRKTALRIPIPPCKSRWLGQTVRAGDDPLLYGRRVTAFGAYWYRCDNSYIVLYGAAGVFSGLFLHLWTIGSGRNETETACGSFGGLCGKLTAFL